MDEKMDETGSNNDADDDIEEIQNEQQAMDMMKGDETAEVQVQWDKVRYTHAQTHKSCIDYIILKNTNERHTNLSTKLNTKKHCSF